MLGGSPLLGWCSSITNPPRFESLSPFCNHQGGLRGWAALFAHVENVPHLTYFHPTVILNAGVWLANNEVLVFKHPTPVLTLKMFSGSKLGRTQRSIWLSVCTAAEPEVLETKSWMEKMQKI